MRLVDLKPLVTLVSHDVHALSFDCPTCGRSITLSIRIGSERHVPMTWGTDSLDPATMTVNPSIANPRHGRIVCQAHFTIDAGAITVR